MPSATHESTLCLHFRGTPKQRSLREKYVTFRKPRRTSSIRDRPYHRGISRLVLATSPRHHLGQIMLESLKPPTEAGTEYWLMIKLFKSGFICPITAFMISLRATSVRAAADDAAALVECAEKDSVLISDNVRTDLIHQAIVDDDTGLCGFI